MTGRHTQSKPTTWEELRGPVAALVVQALLAVALVVADRLLDSTVVLVLLALPVVLLCVLVFVFIRTRGLRPWFAITAAAVLLATVVTAGVAIFVLPPDGEEVGCAPPVELRALAAPSRLATVTELAEAYERSTATGNEGCALVDVFSYTPPSYQEAVAALAGGWEGTALRDVGPRPDLWFPESTSEVDQVEGEILGTGVGLVLRHEVVAHSPLVVAVAGSAVSPEGNTLRETLRWSDLTATAERYGWSLVRPDPSASATGELVLTAMYGGAASPADATAAARDAELRIAAGLDGGGYPLSDTEPLLCRHRQAGAAGTALLITEQAMVRFNRGDPLGVCPAAVPAAGVQPAAGTATGCQAADPLLAFYPTAPHAVDLTAVTLRWPDRTEPAHPEATALREWLAGSEGHPALRASGLRPPAAAAGGTASPISIECGAIPEAFPDLANRAPPTEAARAQAQTAYLAAQRPGRVLIALDVSGSMKEPTPVGLSRLEVATTAVEGSLARLGDNDELGLWVFPDRRGPRERVPIGPAATPHRDVPRRQAAADSLGDLTPGGGTPLHRTIVDGVAAVGPDPEQVTAVVVVTDGVDNSEDPEADEALAALGQDDGVRVFVVAVGEASCELEAIAGVTRRTGGECIRADFPTLESQLTRLFGVLWSGG